jgi:aspartate/methionine/tyrosine aminotransferase
MLIRPFQIERYFAKYEFRVRHLLSASDCEALTLREVLSLADDDDRDLWENLTLRYTESQGHPVLRQEIACLYETISPADVLVAVPEEAIFLAMSVLLSPGDHAIVMFPGYQSLYEIGAALGCEITRWALAPRSEAWEIDLDLLRRSIRQNTKLIVVNFPHNPTGFLPERDQLEAIVGIAAEHGLYLFSDEMYRLLEFHPTARLPSVADMYDRGVTLSGLSKAFALPGLRLGWLAARDRTLLDGCAVVKDYTTICHSAPSEVLGIIALKARAEIVNRALTIIRSNLATAEQFFARHEDIFAWMPPQAGPVAFPRLLSDMRVGGFCEDVVSRTSVMVLPGDVFEYPGNHFRIGLGRIDLPIALELVDDFLRAR